MKRNELRNLIISTLRGLTRSAIVSFVLFLFLTLALLWNTMPLNQKISSATAMEILRFIIQIDGILIGLSGLIATFIMREISSDKRAMVEYITKGNYSTRVMALIMSLLKKTNKEFRKIKWYLIFSILSFVFSVYSSFHRIFYISTLDVDSNIILLPLFFMFCGIVILTFVLFKYPVYISYEDYEEMYERLRKIEEQAKRK